MSVAQYIAALTVAQLEREIACAIANGVDPEYVSELEAALHERKAIGERETLPPPPA